MGYFEYEPKCSVQGELAALIALECREYSLMSSVTRVVEFNPLISRLSKKLALQGGSSERYREVLKNFPYCSFSCPASGPPRPEDWRFGEEARKQPITIYYLFLFCVVTEIN